MADLGLCTGCGAERSGIALNGYVYCDVCADRALAMATGWDVLPNPPPPEVVIGPDRRRHFMRYRYIRTPSGILR